MNFLSLYTEHQEKLKEIRNHPIELQWGTFKMTTTPQGPIHYYKYQKIIKTKKFNTNWYYPCYEKDLSKINYLQPQEGDIFYTQDTKQFFIFIKEEFTYLGTLNPGSLYDFIETEYYEWEWTQIT